MLLAIDTSSLVLSCALAEEDRLIAEWTVQKKLTHSEQLIPHMDEMMKEAGVKKSDITAIACSKGPGSFTGLRIGLATAKMCSYIWKIPLLGINTLESLAWNMAGAQAFILPLIDAQRGNVYAALYGAFDTVYQEYGDEAAPIDTVIEAAVRHGGPIVAVGEGADIYKDKLLAAGIKVASPQHRCTRAGSVALAAWDHLKKGETDDPLTLVPHYIRRSEAEVLWEKKHGVPEDTGKSKIL
jgi:tRNA threonylcarbamoyladenosine biosynthesis protein TsaB